VTCHNCRTECKRHGRDRKEDLSRTARRSPGRHVHNAGPCRAGPQTVAEGSSVSTVERITGVHHTTILKLLVLAGEKCERIMAQKIRNVEVRDVEADEVWAFIGKKEKRVRPEDDQNLGRLLHVRRD